MEAQSRITSTGRRAGIGNDIARAPSVMVPIFKSPIFLYRLGMGWVFGHRFMMLTHMGRRTRRIHRTILAVLRFDGRTKEIMTMSAWSESDWYKNIQAFPALRVESGFTCYSPQYRSLTPAEMAELFVQYRDKHPLFSRIVCQIPGWKWDSSYDEFLELAGSLRGIAFRPRDDDLRSM